MFLTEFFIWSGGGGEKGELYLIESILLSFRRGFGCLLPGNIYLVNFLVKYVV